MGRPKGRKNRKAPRTCNINLCLTEDEFHDLENVSSARGMTSAHYIRSRALNAVARDLTKGFDLYARSG